MRQQFFIFVRCDVGRSYEVRLLLKELDLPFCSEIALISGEWDILVRSECDPEADIGRVLVARIQSLPHVKRTLTEIAYPIFDPADVYFDLDGDI